MKTLFATCAIVLACVLAVAAQPPGPLTTLRAIHALTNAQAAKSLPVDFEATVVYSRDYENLLFIQDEDAGIFLRRPKGIALLQGDRIRVRGTAQESFRPIVVAREVLLLRHGPPPSPVPATFQQLIQSEFDCRLVTVHGMIRSADIVVSNVAPVKSALLQILTSDGAIKVTLDSSDEAAVGGLLDAEVDVTGVAGGIFDDKMQQTGIEIHVASLADIAIRKRAGASPWTLPIVPMDRILSVYRMHDLTPRVRVHGVITYYQPGRAVVLQDGAKSLWIETRTQQPLRIGDRADAVGFPEANQRLLTLKDSEIWDSHVFDPVTPLPGTWRQLALWSSNSPDGHLNDLVSIEGVVATAVRETEQDEYVMTADGKLFTAIYRHPPRQAVLPPMMQVPLGSRIRVTGICIILDAENANPGQEAPFDILLRSFDDITVVAQPSWISIRNLTRIVILLLLVTTAVGFWGFVMMRKVHRQTSAMAARTEADAALERQRSRILEDINAVRPLAEILEQITRMVSSGLYGAPCWCEVTDGARLGERPDQVDEMHVARMEISARSGPPLGALLAAFPAEKRPDTHEGEVLSVGARLAALAIETRRLYSDLLHRSEFDQLTDIHNRFSLDAHLDVLIEEARQKAGIFGLIYIDLDEFKQVNDIYGHQAGDLYLQEVALRMKRQLRSVDMLARLGGDEFAVLVPVARSRVDVEEIANRLERCFDEPFSVEGSLLHGSASVGIALYPEDAITKDSLLSTADAAMYAAKHARHPGVE